MEPSEAEGYELVEKLGEGTFGKVFKATCPRKYGTMAVAVKIVPADADAGETAMEIEMLKDCASDNIVRYHASFPFKNELWIVMEYCAGSSLCDIIEARARCLSELQIAAVMSEALAGLSYLHARGKIHRDIKAANLLLTDRGRVKLADFGVAAQLSATFAKRGTVIGTPFWMAPEVISSPSGPGAEAGYHTKADIWSLGITAIELAEGQPPHASLHPMRAIFLIPTASPPQIKEPESWSDAFNTFLSQCLVKDPNERLDALALERDPFIESGRGGAIAALTELYASAAEPLAKFRERHNTVASNSGTGIPEMDFEAIRKVAEQQRREQDKLERGGTQEFDIMAIRNVASMMSPVGSGAGKPRSTSVVGHTGTMILREGSGAGDDAADDAVDGMGTMILRDGVPGGGTGTMHFSGAAPSSKDETPSFMRQLFGDEAITKTPVNEMASPTGPRHSNRPGKEDPSRRLASASKYNFSHLSVEAIEDELSALQGNLERDLAKLRRQYDKREKALRSELSAKRDSRAGARLG